MYVYHTVPTVQYHTGAILLLLLFVGVRESLKQPNKKYPPTYLPTQHLVLLPTYSTFFILTHLFHTAVYASIFPLSQNPRPFGI